MLVQHPALPYVLISYNVQLETEGGAEDGEQHGRVAAEDRAAVDGQYPCLLFVVIAQRGVVLVDVAEHLDQGVSAAGAHERSN